MSSPKQSSSSIRRRNSPSKRTTTNALPQTFLSNEAQQLLQRNKNNKNNKNMYDDDDDMSTVLDSYVGTGTGTAKSLVDLKNSQYQQKHPGEQQHFGIGNVSGIRKGASIPGGKKSSNNSGVLVDYMTFAEAPAFFDLPIPLYVQHRSNINEQTTSNKTSQQQSQDFFSSPTSPSSKNNLVDPTSNLSGSFGMNLQGSSSSSTQNRSEKQKKITSSFLEPLTKFNTNEQLRYLDQSISQGVSDYQRYEEEIQQKNNQASSSTNKNKNKNKKTMKRGGGGGRRRNSPPTFGDTTTAQQQQASSARIVLPREIAGMVQSLRPTPYQPLRNAIRTRSEEQIYEGDNEQQQDDAKAFQEKIAQEEKRRAVAVKSVAHWQDENEQEFTQQDSSQQQPSPPPRSGGEGSSSDRSHQLYHQTSSSSGVKQQQQQQGQSQSQFLSPHHQDSNALQTVHHGRRASIGTTLMVGDLGLPSRSFPTHSRVDLDRSPIPETRKSPQHQTNVGEEQGGGEGEDNENQQQQQNESDIPVSLNLLHGASPERSGGVRNSVKPRASVQMVAQEQTKKDQQIGSEFHRDILAWYRTESTLLRIAQ